MVQILPPKTNLGSQLGQALGGGLDRGMQQGLQRSQLQGALEEARPIINDPNASFQDKSLAIMKAGAGIPGSERYIGPLLQIMERQDITNRQYGTQGQGGNPSQGMQSGGVSQGASQNMPGKGPQMPGQTGAQMVSGVQPPGVPQPQEGKFGGLLPQIKTQEQMVGEAKQWAMNARDPNQEAPRLQLLEAQNTIAKNSRQELENKALALGVPQNNMSEFMQIMQGFRNEPDQDTAVRNAKMSFDKYLDDKNKLDAINFPGLLTGIFQGKGERATQLKQAENIVQDLIKQGFESQVRTKLASEGLSPTEINELISPLDQKAKSSLGQIPNGPFSQEGYGPDVLQGYLKGQTPQSERAFKSYDEVLKNNPEAIQKMNGHIEKFLEKNISPSTSMLVLRDELWKKGYDWRQISDAMRNVSRNMDLTTNQRNEMAQVETQPPIQSMADIFRDWWRIPGMLRGNK